MQVQEKEKRKGDGKGKGKGTSEVKQHCIDAKTMHMNMEKKMQSKASDSIHLRSATLTPCRPLSHPPPTLIYKRKGARSLIPKMYGGICIHGIIKRTLHHLLTLTLTLMQTPPK
jgi:hypothetical protein